MLGEGGVGETACRKQSSKGKQMREKVCLREKERKSRAVNAWVEGFNVLMSRQGFTVRLRNAHAYTYGTLYPLIAK